MTKIQIPAALRHHTGGQVAVELQGETVGEVLAALAGRHAELGRRICDDTGELRGFVNLYLNGEDVRWLEGRNTPVRSGDTLAIVPSIAGG